jgi:peptidyl-prolyl cis-trans isomerase C
LNVNAVKWIVIGLFLAIALSCAQEEQGEGLARVGNHVITEQTLQDRLTKLPPFVQQQVATPEGRQRFIDALVEEEIIVREATRRGFDDLPEFREEMDQRERDLLVRYFYDRVIQAEAAPADSELLAYYNAHISDYTVPEYATARHILLETRNQALDVKNQIESGGDFGEIAGERSLDEQTKMREGLLSGRIERDAPIRGLGVVPELNEAIFSLEVGEVSDPIKTDLGYHLVKVDERNPETVRPLDEVKKDLVPLLTNTNLEGVRDRVLADLKAKYDVVYLHDSKQATETPEDLFRMASEETSAQKKVGLYQQFIDTYPDNDRAYEAKFMIGFTLAEDLKDYDKAEEAFTEFLAEYPENDLTDDANWMLENMRSGTQPEFESE